ncbi:MAG: hypothetical protein AAF152_11195 [Cyanobacteria bacterium P01_A01_bin.114]
MQLLSASNPISEALIPLLLEWWHQRKRLATGTSVNSLPVFQNTDDRYLEAYHRMMEIYAVVKAGGVQAQTEAVKSHLSRELGALHQLLDGVSDRSPSPLPGEPPSLKKRQIQQEIDELERSVGWRLTTLKSIRAEEEAAVRKCLADIERVLMR